MSSCASQLKGVVSADSSAVFSSEISLKPRMMSMIRSFNSAAGQNNNIILNGAELSRGMSIDGITSVLLVNTAPAAVKGDIRVIDINRFFTAGNDLKFIEFEQNQNGGSCRINININNSPEIMEKFSPEVSDYLNALMAPIATGEKLSKSEYLNVVSSFYNRALRDEIAGSRIQASIEFPGVISSAKGAAYSGRKAEFDIPLVDLLVLETPLIYEVNWR